MLYRAQLRIREKLKVIMSRLYNYLDADVALSRQSQEFNQWFQLFTLTMDDFAWAIKEQQLVILGPHQMGDVVQADGASIIPAELKQKVKEIADFQAQFGIYHNSNHRLSRFSGRGGPGRRGRGSFSRFYPSRGGSFSSRRADYRSNSHSYSENDHPSRGRGSRSRSNSPFPTRFSGSSLPNNKYNGRRGRHGDARQ